MKLAISLIALCVALPVGAYLCPANQVWIDMDCSLCGDSETCLENGGCCPHYLVSPNHEVCCDYIDFTGACVYHGEKCPEGQIWDISTHKCITGIDCGGNLMWNGTRCCPGY